MKQSPGPWARYEEALGTLGSVSAPGPYLQREVSLCGGEFKTPELSYCYTSPARKPTLLYALHRSLKWAQTQCLTLANYKIFQSIK